MTDFPDTPSAEVGQELYEFFVDLLSPRNLGRYINEGRDLYIGDQELGSVAQRILQTGSLAEIEANVALATTTASGGPPIVICIVYPPWGT